MNHVKNRRFGMLMPALLFALAATWGSAAAAREVTVALIGKDEVPPVMTKAKGDGKFDIGDDGSISGTVTTTDVDATMAHIHEAPAGKNGRVIVKLEKVDEHTFKVPAGTKLTAAQLKAFNEGHLYVNVHSPKHKSGEIRGQL